MEFNPTPYDLSAAFGHWLVVFGSCLGVMLIVGLMTALSVAGGRGLSLMGVQIGGGLAELGQTSARRVWALTKLTFLESWRRKALLVFIVFALLFMFAGWFLSSTSNRPELQVKVYVSFVLTAISWLILPVALLLSCWGLPEDIKSRSLHTVVTKPARRSEVVMGRMLGFTLICTLVLVIMGGVGYVWIQRQVTGAARERLVCRVPVYGELSYTDRLGNPAEKGINVGDVWEYRGYIEGATKARAIWSFQGLTPDQMVTEVRQVEGPDGVPVQESFTALRIESRFEAFRTHKGTMDKTLLVGFDLVVPDSNERIELPAFEVEDFGENINYIDPELAYQPVGGSEFKTANLFGDVIRDGKLTIEVKCLDAGQYLGMARPDLFIRTPDKPFAAGYFKALLGIWLMMVLIVVLGVTASCFVKGPVATLLTFTLVVVGQWFREFMDKILGGTWQGGGPIESVIRILRHMNPMTPLRDTWATDFVQFADKIILNVLWLVKAVIPNFEYFRMWPYLAEGFDVSWNASSAALLPSIAITAAYLVPCLLLGHYSLRLRELEAK